MPWLAEIMSAAVLGAACGFAGGLFGVGGGVIAIPVLGLLYALDQRVAQGTVLLMVVPNVLLGFWHYRRLFGLDLRMSGTLGVTALISTYPVARLATQLDPHLLRLGFAVFLAGLSCVIAYRTWRGLVAARSEPFAWGWSAVVGLVGGAASGLFGVGGAFVANPALTAFFGLRQVEAQGQALALVAPAALVALVAYASAGRVDWVVGLPLAIGGTLAISAGVKLAQRFPERHLRFAFCGLLTTTAVLLMLHG